MKRIIVLGCPGSGKSVLSEKLRGITGLPLYHLDNIWWRADGTHISREEFDARLQELLPLDGWILDGDYSRTYELRLRACDTVIFLDYDPPVCREGIAAREGIPRDDCPLTSCDPALLEETVRYGAENRPRVLALLEAYLEKERHILRSRAEAEAWLTALAGKGERA